MADEGSSRRLRKRTVWASVLLSVGALFSIWAGPAVWWILAECRAGCDALGKTEFVQLSGGERLQILKRSVEKGTVYVDYVTDHLSDEPRRCAEFHRLLEVLEADGSLKNATELMLAPTDPRRRLLGVTWRGPVFSCCVSTGVIFRRSAEGRWLASNSGCGE